MNTHCSPGASPPLVSTEHMGAARAEAPGVIVLILERVLSQATVWGPLRAWWHGTVLVAFWDIIWVTFTLINHMVTVVDTYHLPGCSPLPTCHRTLSGMFRKRSEKERISHLAVINSWMCISCKWPTTCPADQIKNFGDSLDSSLFFPPHSHIIKKSCQLGVQNIPSTQPPFTTSTNTSSPRYHLPSPSHYPPLPRVLQWPFGWAPVSNLIGPHPNLLSMYQKPRLLEMKVRSCHFSQWLLNSLSIMSKVFTWPGRLFRYGHWLLLWLNSYHSLLIAFQSHWPYGCSFSMPKHSYLRVCVFVVPFAAPHGHLWSLLPHFI